MNSLIRHVKSRCSSSRVSGAFFLSLALMILVSVPSRVFAQIAGEEGATPSPRFLLASNSGSPKLLDIGRTPVLARRIAIDLNGVTVREALDSISAHAGFRIVYSTDAVPAGGQIRLKADGISVAAALTDVLANARVDVVFNPTGGAALVRRPQGVALQLGSIIGFVRDSVTRQGIAGVTVLVENTSYRAVTGDSGRYRVANVRAGTYTLSIRRIGYAMASRSVSVGADQTVRADFALVLRATQLEGVVTTATGPQLRREVGNVIATIDVDSLAATAPVTNITDLLEARTAGVQVIQSSGTTGASPTIRIRGISSLSLSNEPLIILDGVRIDNSSPSERIGGGLVVNTNIGRLGTLSPDEIESIDVLKGPSAAALYGTAAANGVLIIKTKRGVAGPARWSAYAEAGRVSQPAHFDENYRAWGRNVVNGVPAAAPVQCKLANQSLGTCVRDSLTTFNPLMNPSTTPFTSNPRSLLGLQISGGSQGITYFLSAEHQGETGPFQMPASEITRLTQQRGRSPTPDQINPNQLHETSLRGNFTLPIGHDASLAVSTGYSDRQLLLPFGGGYFAGLEVQTYFAPGYRTPTNGTSSAFIGDIFSVTSEQHDQRFTGSSSLNWHPLAWLETRAVAGIDQNQGYGTRFSFFGEGPSGSWGPPGQTGGLVASRTDFSRYSVDLGATATWSATTGLTARTSVGAQWFKDTHYQTDVLGYGLAPFGQNTQGAQQQRTQEITNENATYGEFVEEVLGWRERRFLTLGVRTDQNSAFGSNAGNAVYPRAALSWVLSDEGWFPKNVLGISSLRLRAATGQAGQFPTVTTAAIPFVTAFTVPINGVETPALRLQSIGNPNLKPEVTTEVETGADLGLFHSRLAFEATVYDKKSRDALVLVPLPPSTGASQTGVATQWQNLAEVQNRGFELSVDAKVFQSNSFSWSALVTSSFLSNKLVTAGSAQLAQTQGVRNAVGYPLFGLWARPILSYSDANKDGILTANEIVVGPNAVYKGPTIPTREAGFTNTFTFLNDRLKLTSVLDYRGGFYNKGGYGNQRCLTGNCRAVNDPTAPLADQAAAVASTSPAFGNTIWGFFVPNDFIRFRELSVTALLPQFLTRGSVRLRDASITLSGRNLGLLWTRYPGIDPEINWLVANSGGGNDDLVGLPPLRYYLLRLNLGF